MLRGVPNVKLHYIPIGLASIEEIPVICVPDTTPDWISKVVPIQTKNCTCFIKNLMRFKFATNILPFSKLFWIFWNFSPFLNAMYKNSYSAKSDALIISLICINLAKGKIIVHILKTESQSYVCTTVLLMTLVILAVLSNPQLRRIPSSTNGWKQQSRIALLWTVRYCEVLKSIQLICIKGNRINLVQIFIVCSLFIFFKHIIINIRL